MHIYEIQKNDTDEFISFVGIHSRAAMEKQTENRLMDMGRGEERVRCMERVTWELTLPYVKQPMGICCLAQETQMGALYQSRGVGWGRRWEGGSKESGYMYTYG